MSITTYIPSSDKVIKELSVDFSRRTSTQRILLSQYDKSYPIIKVNLFNNGTKYELPTDATASIRWFKPDRKFCYNTALGCTKDRTGIYIEITEQMSMVAGECKANVEISNGTSTIHTAILYTVVARDPIASAISGESESEIKIIEDLVDRAETAAKKCEGAAESASEAKKSAESAATSATNAKTSETNAATSASSASTSATNAKTSETNAATSASEAKKSAESSDFANYGYASVTIDSSSITNMGQLRTYINSKNSEGKHFFFDFHNYISNAYVCTVSMFSANNINYCLIFDIIGKKTYCDYAGYSDSTTVANYLANNSNDLVSIIKMDDATITLKQVKTLLDEVNSLGHHVLFDTYSLGQAGFYLTTISFTDSDSKLTIFDLVGAKLNAVAYKEDMTLVEVMQGASKVITEENARILTDLISNISYRVAKLEGKTESVEWEEVQAKVVQGFGNDYYPTYDKDKGESGTQLTVDWAYQTSSSATEVKTTIPFNVVHHSEKASTSPVAVLDDEWSIDSYYTTKTTAEESFDSDMGSENTHAANMMYMESEYTLPFGTQFDAPEAILTVAEGKTLPAGTYYFKATVIGDGASGDGGYLQFTLASDVAAGHQLRLQNCWWGAAMIGNYLREFSDGASGTVIQSCVLSSGQTGTFLGTTWGTDGDVDKTLLLTESGHHLNNIHRIKFGYSRWSKSGLRQWLNSEGFNWWKSMNIWDVAPSYSGYRGYLSGLSEELRSVIKPIRRWLRLNTVTDGGVYEYTYDKIFLHVPYEQYIQTENNGGKEGSCSRWEYWKSKLDSYNETRGTSLTQFGLWQTYSILIKTNQSGSAQHNWSMSATRSNVRDVWRVISSGNVSNAAAYGGHCCCPAFVICK